MTLFIQYFRNYLLKGLLQSLSDSFNNSAINWKSLFRTCHKFIVIGCKTILLLLGTNFFLHRVNDIFTSFFVNNNNNNNNNKPNRHTKNEITFFPLRIPQFFVFERDNQTAMVNFTLPRMRQTNGTSFRSSRWFRCFRTSLDYLRLIGNSPPGMYLFSNVSITGAIAR